MLNEYDEYWHICAYKDEERQGQIQEYLIGRSQGFPRKCEVEGEFLEVDGSTELSLKGAEVVFGGLPQKNFEISGSEKCILVDLGDGFAMDNGESKKILRSDRGSEPPRPSPWIRHWVSQVVVINI